ncbi:MAG: KH domain-containing protein [Candidatus Micrarchaeota archaeon]|nr:KH domain-containing protein [Candidatus Micrarchaeota archaeon]
MKVTESIVLPKKRYKNLMTKNDIRLKYEETCNVTLSFEKDYIAVVEGEAQNVFFAKTVLEAYAKGFGMKTAIKILTRDYSYRIINLKDFGKNVKDLKRIKGRIIGKKGKAKKTIENLTNCKIIIRGKKVALIGPPESVDDANESILDLIEGKKHSTIYSNLENKNRIRKLQSNFWTNKP